MSHVIADPENMKVVPSPPAPQSRRIIAMGLRGVFRCVMGLRQPRQNSWLSTWTREQPKASQIPWTVVGEALRARSGTCGGLNHEGAPVICQKCEPLVVPVAI